MSEQTFTARCDMCDWTLTLPDDCSIGAVPEILKRIRDETDAHTVEAHDSGADLIVQLRRAADVPVFRETKTGWLLRTAADTLEKERALADRLASALDFELLAQDRSTHDSDALAAWRAQRAIEADE